jgi:hypothetical protein
VTDSGSHIQEARRAELEHDRDEVARRLQVEKRRYREMKHYDGDRDDVRRYIAIYQEQLHTIEGELTVRHAEGDLDAVAGRWTSGAEDDG